MSNAEQCRCLRVFYAAAVLMLFSASAAAEQAKFRMVTAKLLDVRSVVEPLGRQTVTLGGALKLVPRPDRAAKAHFRNGFQVRIYRIAAPGATPSPLEMFEPCLVFVGNRYAVGGSEGIEEFTLLLDDPGWLTLVNGQAPEPGRYLMVAEVLGDENPIVRIDHDPAGKTLANYFKTGIYFEVVPPPKPPDAVRIEAALKRGREFWDKVRVAAKVNAGDRDCIHLVAQPASDPDHLLADALACTGRIAADEVTEHASPT